MRYVCLSLVRGCTILLLLFNFLSGFLSAQDLEAGERYQLTSGDQVRILVYNQPDLSSSQEVSSDGNVTLPLIKEVFVEGLTAGEAQLKIANEFIKQEFLRAPEVTVIVVSVRAKSITVLGEVSRRGTAQLPIGKRKITLLEAIALAGGFSDVAKKKEVRVERLSPDKQSTEVFIVNVDAQLDRKVGSGSQSVFHVYPGDTIFVPRRIF